MVPMEDEDHVHADNYYNRLRANVGAQRLERYFQVAEPTLDLERLSAREFQLTCCQTRKYVPPKIECLPLEVLRYISTFVTYPRRVVLTFTCLNAYPFLPPVWEMKSNPNNDFAAAVLLHNYEYSLPGNWCLQSMETDILQLLLRIRPLF